VHLLCFSVAPLVRMSGTREIQLRNSCSSVRVTARPWKRRWKRQVWFTLGWNGLSFVLFVKHLISWRSEWKVSAYSPWLLQIVKLL
jgi:hypothetical protein